MFENKEAEDQAREEVNASVGRFNKKYGVLASPDPFLVDGLNKKRANGIYVTSFKALLEQVIRNGNLSRDFNIATMRSDFERYVVDSCHNFSVKKAKKDEIERVRRTHADANGGLGKDAWWREVDKTIDSVCWEKIDRVSDDYKKRTTRIRDMVSESNRILNGNGAVSREDVQKITGYIAALRRTNEKRAPFWSFINFFRGRAELREANNMETQLKAKLGDNIYQDTLKELTDADGTIGRVRSQIDQKKNIKYDFAVAPNEKKDTKEVKQKIEKNKEKPKEKHLVDEELVNSEVKTVKNQIQEAPKVPGNDKLYRLIGDKNFETKIKNEIRAVLKAAEIVLDKDKEVDLIYNTLLDNAKSLNESYHNNKNSNASQEDIDSGVCEMSTSMYTDAYFKLEDFNLKPLPRVVAAQKLADIMLNNLTVVGFEKDEFGKYGENYAVKNGEDAGGLLQFGKDPMTKEESDVVLEYAIKELSK